MKEAGVIASPRRRIAFIVIAALMLVLWGWSLVPPIENWNNPHEDGFSYVGVFYASPICLPIGFVLLHGALVGRGRPAQRARTAMRMVSEVLCIVVAFPILRYVANSTGGM